MGKRKRKVDNNKTPPPPDITPPQEVLQLQQGSSGQAESSARPSIMDTASTSLKRPASLQSPVNQNHSSSRTMLMRNARHAISRHYSRRSSTSHIDASPSKWSGSPLHDSKFSFKLSGKDHPDLHYRGSAERSFHKPERICSSSSVLSANLGKIECGICDKRLQKKPFLLDDSNIPASDLSVVAVLVCGHAYHADCLEQKTSHEERQDPPCPFCAQELEC